MAAPLALFIVVLVIASVVQLILAIAGFLGFLGVPFLLLALPLIIINGIVSALLHYTCWNALPAGYRKNDPQTASLLLLPIFNLYWCFITFPNMGKGFDQCLASNQLDAGMKKEQLGTFYACALLAEFVTGLIPVMSGLVSLTTLLLFLLFYIEVIKAAGAIAKMQGQLVAQPVYDFVGVTSAAGSSEVGYVEQPGTPMQKLLRLAKHHNGELSIAQMTMDTHFTKEELKSLLDEAQRDGFVEVMNHPETGAVRYKFDVD